MPSRRNVLFAMIVLVAALGLGAGTLLLTGGGRIGEVTGTGTALVGGQFTLTDQNGKTVTDASFRGKYMLVFFGYTYCPDICPTELQVMTRAIQSMGPAGEKITPIFVSIDPERDTPKVLKSYVENFDPRLVGLTGSAQQITVAARAYRVYYARAGKTGTSDYLMDHSSIIYLMDPQGRFVKHFSYSTDAAALAEALASATSVSP